MAIFTETQEFVVEICINCGIAFGLPKYYADIRSKDHQSFSCPNGHKQFYTSKSNEEKLREQVRNVQAKLANAEFELLAREKQINRLQKRISNGVCPCCHRQFVQLARHMKTKHPEYAEQA